MGHNYTKVRPLPIETPYVIVDTRTYDIVESNHCYERAFGHAPIGYNVNWIMPYFVRKTHSLIFKQFKGKPTHTIAERANAAMSKHRYMVINNGYGTTNKVRIVMEAYSSTLLKMYMFPISCINQPQIPRPSLAENCTMEPAYIVEDVPGRICVMLDMANSTQFLYENDIDSITQIYYKIVERVDSIVCKKYHPYARIHETAGDSMFIVVDSKYPDRVTMTLAMVNEILSETSQILSGHGDYYFRCGICTGDLVGGILDGKSYRLFGKAVNLAARMESAASKDTIVMCETTARDLQTEENVSLEYKTIECKGFPEPVRVALYPVSKTHLTLQRRASFIDLQSLIDL